MHEQLSLTIILQLRTCSKFKFDFLPFPRKMTKLLAALQTQRENARFAHFRSWAYLKITSQSWQKMAFKMKAEAAAERESCNFIMYNLSEFLRTIKRERNLISTVLYSSFLSEMKEWKKLQCTVSKAKISPFQM